MSETVGSAVRAAESALRAALDLGVDATSAEAVVSGLRSLAAVRNLAAAVESRLLAAAEQSRLDGALGTASVLDVLVDCQPITAADGRRRVERAAALTPGRSLVGEALPPRAPALAAACHEGVITERHADVVLAALDHLPHWCDSATVEIVEKTLVDASRHLHPAAVARMAEQLRARLDQDGPEPHDDGPQRRRGLRRVARADGTVRFTLDTDALGAATIDAVLDPLAAPCPADDGERDPRSAVQRGHDALVEAMQRLLRSDTLPAANGSVATVVVTTTRSELLAGAGLALTDRGHVVPVPDLLAACTGDTAFLPVVFGERSEVLHLGRAQRLASPAQRRALAARDRGCTFPGCDRPPAWTQAHHVREWDRDSGTTDIDNLCLLCRHHHRTFRANGWTVRMVGGVPEWVPPPWIDPARRPRRNAAHHPPEIVFALPPSVRGSPTNARR